MQSLFISSFLVFVLWFNTSVALAESIAERYSNYPNWNHKPFLEKRTGDIYYPKWLQGTWNVSSTLTEQIAPFAPTLVTPGFESNRRYLQQPLHFQVRFQPHTISTPQSWPLPPLSTVNSQVIADRQFNGLEIARAYLGQDGVLSVIDRKNPTCLITLFPQQRQLISTVIGHSEVAPSTEQFFATELTQQQFFANSGLFINEVETTTAYRLLNPEQIEADQITAIYLSPQDPKYFQALNQPVALYRYQLILSLMKK